MANEEHIEILKQGAGGWNRWRRQNPAISPDLFRADLANADLREVDLKGALLVEANLSGANLRYAWLINANLIGTNFSKANLSGAEFKGANLKRANLNYIDCTNKSFLLPDSPLNYTDFSYADLTDASLVHAQLIDVNFSNAILVRADFSYADITDADLSEANLRGANFTDANMQRIYLYNANLKGTILKGADLSHAAMSITTFGDVDLSLVKGLNTVTHYGPSTIGIDTIYRSQLNIPEVFLRGIGVSDEFITYMHSLLGKAIEFCSCFISYSHKDEEFARRLYSRLRDSDIRAWYAPEDIKGGEKLYDQIERAIQLHDRLLIVLSEHSLQSEWVMTEIRNARWVEIKEKRRKLFPIRLVDFETIKRWKCFDADTGKDLAVEVREYFIPDFSNWKDYDAFEGAFQRLLRDLRAEQEEQTRT